MPILDASFLIDVERGVPRATQILQAMVDAEEELLVPGQVAIEFASGRDSPPTALKRLVRAFVILDLDLATIQAAAEIGRASRASGTFAGWADTQIAASAKTHATWVLTADGRDFARMRVDHWDYRTGDGPISYDEPSP